MWRTFAWSDGMLALPIGVPWQYGGQERGAPVVHAAVGERRADGDEGGQVLVLGAEPVGDPRAHARPDEVVAAGVQLQQRAAVRRVGAVQERRMQRSSTHCATCGNSSLTGRPLWPYCLNFHGDFSSLPGLGELHARLREGVRLAVVALEQRLGVERVDVRRPALHEEEDDALRPRARNAAASAASRIVHRRRAPAPARASLARRDSQSPPALRWSIARREIVFEWARVHARSSQVDELVRSEERLAEQRPRRAQASPSGSGRGSSRARSLLRASDGGRA